MLNHITIENILFIDVETVPQTAGYNELSPKMKELWDKKSAYICKEGQLPEEVYERAGIWAEFGKIVCISAGFIYRREGQSVFRIKSFFAAEEKQLLAEFCTLLRTFFRKKKNAQLCAHNGKEFDFPFIARRVLINGLELPGVLDVAGSKPWEVPFIDTMELWKFGDYKHFCSLDLLTAIFGVPSPKDDIDGSKIATVYYDEGDTERIVSYCEKDVTAVAQLLLRYRGEPLITTVERA